MPNGDPLNMLDTATMVKESVDIGTKYISDLSHATDDSAHIFDKISEGNVSNASSVEIQTEMTMKITNLIERLIENTKDVILELNKVVGELVGQK